MGIRSCSPGDLMSWGKGSRRICQVAHVQADISGSLTVTSAYNVLTPALVMTIIITCSFRFATHRARIVLADQFIEQQTSVHFEGIIFVHC